MAPTGPLSPEQFDTWVQHCIYILDFLADLTPDRRRQMVCTQAIIPIPHLRFLYTAYEGPTPLLASGRN